MMNGGGGKEAGEGEGGAAQCPIIICVLAQLLRHLINELETEEESVAAQTLSTVFEAGGKAWPGLSILQLAFSRWQPLNFAQ